MCVCRAHTHVCAYVEACAHACVQRCMRRCMRVCWFSLVILVIKKMKRKEVSFIGGKTATARQQQSKQASSAARLWA